MVAQHPFSHNKAGVMILSYRRTQHIVCVQRILPMPSWGFDPQINPEATWKLLISLTASAICGKQARFLDNLMHVNGEIKINFEGVREYTRSAEKFLPFMNHNNYNTKQI